MASSEVDICNAALSHLGDRANVVSINPPEGSAQADHCARHFPIARDTALTDHDWSFARTRRALAQLESPVPGWAYAYAKPADCITIRAIVSADALDLTYGVALSGRQTHFEIETDDLTGAELILTNEPNAVVIFTRLVTDAGRFPPDFADALSWLLASKLAGPVLKGQAARVAAKDCYAAYQSLLMTAKTRDANQGARRQSFVPSSVRARGAAVRTMELDRFTRTETAYIAYPDGLIE